VELPLTSCLENVSESLAGELHKLEAVYPKLASRVSSTGAVTVAGEFDVMADGKHIDCFSIQIQLPAEYPISVPLVFETAGRIPRIPDRHVNPDGSACLFVPDARWKHWPVGSDLLQFVSGPVHYHFLAQAYFELEGKWLFGERPHGDDGVLDLHVPDLQYSVASRRRPLSRPGAYPVHRGKKLANSRR
jgi:hypothetical protein